MEKVESMATTLRITSATAAFTIIVGVISLRPAYAFGTIDEIGQQGEHRKITVAALKCPAGDIDYYCFEENSNSMKLVAGYGFNSVSDYTWKLNTSKMGAVGIPDLNAPLGDRFHCDNADYSPEAGYPRTVIERDAALNDCINEARKNFRAAVEKARELVNVKGMLNRQAAGECTWSRSGTGVSNLNTLPLRCNIIGRLGVTAHIIQDFYAHSNYSDGTATYSLQTRTIIPALNQSKLFPPLAAFWAGNDYNVTPFPDSVNSEVNSKLTTGCFSLPEKVNWLTSWAGIEISSSIDCANRIRHRDLNKDEGVIFAGVGYDGTTFRGKAGNNFGKSLDLAVDNTEKMWSDFAYALEVKYPELNGTRAKRMVCSLTVDRPERYCASLS